MDNWDQNADAWKKETKPWEESDGWKREQGYQPGETEAARNPNICRSFEVTIGVRPTVPTTQVENSSDIKVKDRDALKLIATLSAGQKATTEEGEVFQFSTKRYMWVKIPWEVC